MADSTLLYDNGKFIRQESKSKLETALERNASLALENAQLKSERDKYRAIASAARKCLETHRVGAGQKIEGIKAERDQHRAVCANDLAVVDQIRACREARTGNVWGGPETLDWLEKRYGLTPQQRSELENVGN